VVGGVIGGLIYGVCYSIVALAIHFGSGGRALEAIGVSPLKLVVLYFVGGMVGGGLVGLMWPLTRARVGSIAVGSVGFLPVCIGAGVLVIPDVSDAAIASTGAAVILGVAVGLKFRE
jgi:hypothetical protein